MSIFRSRLNGYEDHCTDCGDCDVGAGATQARADQAQEDSNAHKEAVKEIEKFGGRVEYGVDDWDNDGIKIQINVVSFPNTNLNDDDLLPASTSSSSDSPL